MRLPSLGRTRVVPLIIACAVFMENLDSTIIATALPQIARAMNEDPLHLSLAITAYLLSLAVFIPLSGWVADRYGARRVFRAAILEFTLGRSEEHTSELQSLMRISYAVFCLKKKQDKNTSKK